MNFKEYIKDKLFTIITIIMSYFIILLMFFAFKINTSLIIATTCIIFVSTFAILLMEFFKKRTFYTNIISNTEKLDKAYLVLETIEKPDFYDGKLLYQILYEINKSMNENLKIFELQMVDFKEYIEMWIHEIKIPISSLILIAHNNKSKFDKKTMEQLHRIEDYIEQVLYYVRSENAEKDYLINKVSLNKIINNVALKNKDDLLENKINLIVENITTEVYTDSKWLEFIINQIINNSIKYKRNIKNSYIKITTKEDKEQTQIIIQDNGIGIPESDIPKVFEKTFTGNNGRIKAKSTGMGLFIAKNLCKKLGHKILIESKEQKYTKVKIIIAKNNFYEVTK